MNGNQARAAILDFELCHAELAATLQTRAKLLPGVSTADQETMADEMGGIAKVEALARGLPGAPAMAALITAFGDAKKLAAFVDKTLGGNVAAVAALADKGCGRDPDKLALLAQAFVTDALAFNGVLKGGGLGSHPEALAEIFASGCGGNPDSMLKFCKTFDDDTKRGQLRGALDEGGLGQAPAALGALAKGDDGALLLKVAKDADKTALKNMLLSGGMGGKAPDHPETLKSVLVDALGGSPARLKELHDAFPHANGKMPELQSLLQALNGKSADGAVTAGGRMKGLMDAFKQRDQALTTAQLAAKVYSPFYTEISGRAVDARGLQAKGGATLRGVPDALAQRADPPPGRKVGAVTAALKDEGAQNLLDLLTPDLAVQDLLAQSRRRLAAAGASAAALESDTADRAADSAASEASTKAIDEAGELADALAKKPDGGLPAELAALTQAAEACFKAAGDEPGAVLRKSATDTGKLAMAAAKAALARQADMKIAGMGAAAAAQLGALAAAGTILARVDADPSTGEGEKDAMRRLVTATSQALKASALAGQVTDNSVQAGKARAAAAAALNKPEASVEVSAELDLRKKAAEDSTATVLSLVNALIAAESPIDPGLLAQASAAAEAAVRAGRGTVDTVVMDAALKAGKALSDQVAKRAKEVAAVAELGLAYARPEAKAGVVVATEITGLEAALARDHAAALFSDKPAIVLIQQAQRKAAVVASQSALAAADLARLTELGDAELASLAKAQAVRQASIDGTPQADTEEEANVLAATKAQAAKLAANALTGPPAPAVPITSALIEEAAKAAEEAASAAAGASDKVRRDLALAEGKNAAAAASAALAANTRKLLADRKTAKAADATAKTNASRVASNAGVTNFTSAIQPGDRAAIKAAFGKALESIAEAGAAQLAEFAESDVGVKDARAAAAVAAARAACPGARYLLKLKSVQADALAQQTLAVLATAKATATVAGLAAVPPAPWPPAGPPHVKAGAIAAPTEAEMRNATVLCDAAISAGTSWVAAAVVFADASREYYRLAAAVSNRSPAEDQELLDIDLMHNQGKDTAGAPKMKVDAQTALVAVNTQSSALGALATALMRAAQIRRVNFNPLGNSHLAANITVDAAPTNLETAAGFASTIGAKAFKTVMMPDGSLSTTPPTCTASLLASGANMETAALDIPNPGMPPPVGVPMPTNMQVAGHATCKIDLYHMCARHSRTHFTFGEDELAPEEDVLMSEFVATRTGGLKWHGGTETNSGLTKLVSPKEKKVAALPSKTTSLWPEGVTPQQIAAAAALALTQIKAGKAPSFEHFVYNHDPAKHFYSEIIPGIAVGPLTLEVTLGVKAASAAVGADIEVRMFYPNGVERLTVPDLHTLKSASGL